MKIDRPLSIPMPMPFVPNVAVGVPSGDMVHTDFCFSLRGLSFNGIGQVAMVSGRNSVVGNCRNMLVRGAREVSKRGRIDYILFLDSDMTFPPDTLQRLISHKKDIAGAVYHRRVPPFDVMGRTLDNNPLQVNGGIHQLAGIPTGVMLVHMRVFDKVEEPWFRHPLNVDLKDNEGEDFYFCNAARAAGFEVWADFDLSMQVGHIGQYIYRPPTIQAAARQAELLAANHPDRESKATRSEVPDLTAPVPMVANG